jgi:Domain of unknown function (DUF5916)/Carbohydrate family 9 binding domain-like
MRPASPYAGGRSGGAKVIQRGWVLLFFACLVARKPAVAQGRLTATSIIGGVQIDGRLTESFWESADSIWELRQREPAQGAPCTERTVMKVARDRDALYVGVHAYDSDLRGIRATQLRRDADLSVDDEITLLIDSFHDRRSGFVFSTNPNGAMWDAQFTGVDEVDENWNGIWDVAVARDTTGWTAEFRIPFRTLRFRSGGGSFGFNAQRFIRRKNETALWRGWGRTEGLYRLIYEGEVGGFDDLHRGRDLEIKPYALGRATATDHDAVGNALASGTLSGKAGADAKLAVTPTLTADLTVNTDFAQVEVDQQVINLTRLPTFFPEKRDFFLESSSIFDFATPTRVQPFYSRRIGLGDSGQIVPILGGGRVYGKAGPWALGLLDAQTGSGDRANDLVVRVKHDLLDRSYIGAIGVQRIPDAGGAERIAGADIDLPLVVGGLNLEPSFWIMGSHTPITPGVPLAWRFGTDFPNDLFDAFISLYRIDAGFNPTLGFVQRAGIWETTSHIDFMPRPHVLGIRQLDLLFPIPSWDIIADESGSIFRDRDWQTATFEWRPLGGDFQSGAHFEVNIQRFFDAPPDSFAIFPGATLAPGRYWWTRGELQYQTSASHPFSLGSLLSWGHFYNGRSTELDLQGDWRGGGHVILGATLSRNRVSLPAGKFTATLVTGRLEYAFNTRISFLGFVQYDNENERVDFNLRFHWIPQIGDDLFVVWNSGYTTDADAPHRFPSLRSLGRPLNGALVLKAVHRFAL